MPYHAINNVQLHYELTGNDSGEVILFLHGLGSSGRDWEAQVTEFVSDYRVLVVDMRGHGQSDKPKEAYTMAQFASDTLELLDKLAIDKVHVVGLSMGAVNDPAASYGA